MKDGKYAEIINEIATYVYQDDILKAERNYHLVTPDGVTREVDLLVTTKSGKRIIFEVRDRNGNQGIEWIDQAYGKYIDSDIDKVWVCTYGSSNLSSVAIKSAKYRKIGWRNIDHSDLGNQKETIFWSDAIKPLFECALLRINGVEISNNDVSYNVVREVCDREVSTLIRQNYENVKTQTFCEYNSIIEAAIGEPLKITYRVPIVHQMIRDCFTEKYDITDIDETENRNYLYISEKHSVYLSDNMLTVDFSVISRFMKEGYILPSDFWINTRVIKDRYGSFNTIRMVDIDGNSEVIPQAIYGVKRREYRGFCPFDET